MKIGIKNTFFDPDRSYRLAQDRSVPLYEFDFYIDKIEQKLRDIKSQQNVKKDDPDYYNDCTDGEY